jgi:ADP-heptose:LPS heptosyltransferase
MQEKSARVAIPGGTMIFRKEPDRIMKATLKIKPDAKILLIRVLGIGEGVMFGPVLKHLRRNYPETDIHVMTGNPQTGFFAGSGLVDNTIAVDESKLVSKNIPYVLRLIARLRKEKYDLVISSHPHVFYSLFVRMLGPRKSIGFNWSNRGIFYKIGIGPKVVPRPFQFMRLLEPLGIEGDAEVIPFFTPDDLEKSLELMKRIDKKTCTVVGFCPGGAQNTGINFTQKRWPLERYVELAGLLLKEEAKIAVFGGPSDKKEGIELTGKFGRDVHDLTGEFSLAETQAAMNYCDVIVAHDSGPLHMAVASGAPVVGIYGATRPSTCYDHGELIMLRHEVDCGPCCPEYPDQYPFDIPLQCDRDMECMMGISAKQVFNEVKPYLKSRTEQNVEI